MLGSSRAGPARLPDQDGRLGPPGWWKGPALLRDVGSAGLEGRPPPGRGPHARCLVRGSASAAARCTKRVRGWRGAQRPSPGCPGSRRGSDQKASQLACCVCSAVSDGSKGTRELRPHHARCSLRGPNPWPWHLSCAACPPVPGLDPPCRSGSSSEGARAPALRPESLEGPMALKSGQAPGLGGPCGRGARGHVWPRAPPPPPRPPSRRSRPGTGAISAVPGSTNDAETRPLFLPFTHFQPLCEPALFRVALAGS